MENNQTSAPQFSEPQFTGDPAAFRTRHPSDNALYKQVNTKLLEKIPPPRVAGDQTMQLAEVFGDDGAAKMDEVEKLKQIVFHMVGDTGNTRDPKSMDMITGKLCNDYQGEAAAETPSFCFHLGDVVYSFGEGIYYYDQFYDPFRNYPAPILAIPGNHDGLVYRGDELETLEAFLRNFVNDEPVQTDEAGGLVRTAITQPAVYFALDAPYVTIIGLYSNVLEDPGVISSQGNADSPIGDEQLTFLTAQLNRVKDLKKAVILAVHHPPYAWGGNHSGSPKMLAEIDQCCADADFWPHAVVSGHAHNYQRFTRSHNGYDIPYIICGNSGHDHLALRSNKTTALRAPQNITPELIFENYDDQNYGYLRVICDASQVRIEYHDADPSQKTYSDAVTVDLASHTMISN